MRKSLEPRRLVEVFGSPKSVQVGKRHEGMERREASPATGGGKPLKA
jgi:hypothetical protein